MAMTRFDPREKFADRLWTREQVATMVEPLPEWLSGPCRLSLNGSWLIICDHVKTACWNEPLPEFGDYDGLIRAFNAMPIEPGCESLFGRSENVNHKRQGYDDRQWTPEEIAALKSECAKPYEPNMIPRIWQTKQEAEDAKNKRTRAVLDRLAGPWKNLDEKPVPTGPGHGEVFINGTLDLRGVDVRPGRIELKASDEHVDLSQYLDIPTEQPEDIWNRLQREYAHKIPACFTRNVDLSIFAPAARHQLEFMLANGAKVCLEEFDYGNQLKVRWAWIAGADGEVRSQMAFLHWYPDGWDMKREPEKPEPMVWPFPPYEPKQAEAGRRGLGDLVKASQRFHPRGARCAAQGRSEPRACTA